VTEIIDVDFKKPAVDGESPMVHRRKTPCLHGKTLLDDRLRTITCQLCNAVLDPFEVLNDISKDWERHAIRLRNINGEVKRLRGEVFDLKREKKNLQAAVRRAKGKL